MVVAGLWLWWAAPWADGNDRWKLVADQPSVTYGQVIATGEHDAWAFGWKILGIAAWVPVADGPHRPTAFHWDGDRWKKSDFPVERGDVGPVAASGPSRVWALAGGSVLRWDGRAWTTVRKIPATAWTLAAAGDDVWLLGDREVWHHDGTTWSMSRVSFRTRHVSARSASDVWALDDDGPSVHHFDGRTWTRVDLSAHLPKAPPPFADVPPGPLHARLSAITADPSGVWITGEIGMSSFLLFWTGSGWQTEDTSVKAGRLPREIPPVPDGRGGHWFVGSTDVNGLDSALAHRDLVGHWTKIPAGGQLTSLSAVPGGPLLATGRIGRASGVFRNLP
ncbi:hypothetical protein C1J01_01515 [Nonomuraea aridisoli]|uniref:Carbohydrate-binding protein n=1 Tax=Nonomuraea aridisoli TaxID=2070368 RepID=A0A2W2EG74_9ACTN|nr:hypothetical protein C1J01_01515 [Nonomuraea aridisoli]